MAKDDYYVIVYQILSYLYRTLKEGKSVEPNMIKYDGTLFNINEKYWSYIMENMLKQGYIDGITITEVWEGIVISDLDRCQITPDGIDYLCDNNRIKRAYDFAKDIINILPIKL